MRSPGPCSLGGPTAAYVVGVDVEHEPEGLHAQAHGGGRGGTGPLPALSSMAAATGWERGNGLLQLVGELGG